MVFMRIGVSVACTFALVASVSAGIPTNMGFDHVGITVSDVDMAADFLVKVFDCKFDWQVKREPEPYAGERGWDKIFDIHPMSYLPNVMMLKCGDHHLAQYIELFEFVSPDQVVPHADTRGWQRFSDIGHTYVAFTVKNIESAMEYIKSLNLKGVRFVQDPPMEFPLRGEICTSTFITTPWGMWIEISEWSISGPQGTVIKALDDAEEADVSEGGDTTINTAHPDVGKNIMEIDTPALFIDADAVEHNMGLIYNRTKEAGMRWRPPAKAHKSPDMARMYLKHGAKGILVLKASEAETFADAGIDDILIANEIIGASKLATVARVAKKVKRLGIIVDHQENIFALANVIQAAHTKIDVYVDVNTGMNRTGVSPENAVELASTIVELEQQGTGLHFRGIHGYEGHTPVLEPEAKTTETGRCHNKMVRAKELIEEAGHTVEVLTGGGSSNYIDAVNTGILTEVQAGGGALTDLLYYHKAHLKDHGHQLGIFVLAQIMHVSEDGTRAMGDAGHKAMGWHPFAGLPRVHGHDDIEVYGLSAEHTKLRIPKDSLIRGNKLILEPGYCDSFMFMHRRIHVVRGGTVEDVWPITASGKLQ